MAVSFLINVSEEEFKAFLKEALQEILSGEQQNQVPDVLDVQQAAYFLHLKVTTLYEKTSKKQVPHFKKGNKLYFYKTELEEWIKQGKVKSFNDMESEASSWLLHHRKAG